jgi:hypothetical protein
VARSNVTLAGHLAGHLLSSANSASRSSLVAPSTSFVTAGTTRAELSDFALTGIDALLLLFVMPSSRW